MSYAIAAAGTGGHVFPGLAVGRALVDLGVDREDVLYVGGSRLEAEIYPAEGFPFLELELRGLRRSLSSENLGIPRVVGRAVSRIGEELASREVAVLLGMGGYVTVPAVLAARRRRRAAMVSEQNAEAGLANRLSAYLSRRVFGAFPRTEGLRRAEWVGNPIRPEIVAGDVARTDSAERYGLDPDLPTLGVIGGSLGAKVLNDGVVEMVEEGAGGDLQILHLSGRAEAERLEEAAKRSDSTWRVVPFEDQMEFFYPMVDLVVSRAGGMVAELTATATPSILVPGTFGSGSHQQFNAQVLERYGAATALPEERMAELGSLVRDLFQDDDRLSDMRSACESLARPDAATTIARAMMDVAS